jgi:predicted transcriptional regulator
MSNITKLTSKEEEVMEMIWELGECSPKDVLSIYPEPKPHINTVATMFQSLERKGYLSHKSQGRGYVYVPVVLQREYGKNKLQTFVNRYFGNSYLNVVSALVQEEKVSEQELIDFLAELKKGKNL